MRTLYPGRYWGRFILGSFFFFFFEMFRTIIAGNFIAFAAAF